MAINQKILSKIDEKTQTDTAKRKYIKDYLSKIEEGRQAKRIINGFIKNI